MLRVFLNSRLHPASSRFHVGRPEDAWIAHHPYHCLGSRIVLQLGIDDQVLELFSLKPFGKKNDLAARCRYEVRDNVVLGNRVKKSGAMRVETAKPGKGKCRRHNTTSQTVLRTPGVRDPHKNKIL